ncbi:MAG: hypothetical protein ACR2IL_11940 [Chitinophagaceae bacterium]
MKKILWGLCISICIQSPFLLKAQQSWQQRMENKARYYTKQLMRNVKLPDSLETSVYQINLHVSMRIDSLYAGNYMEHERKPLMRKVFIERDSAYKSIMSQQQYLRYDDWQREQWEKKQAEKK